MLQAATITNPKAALIYEDFPILAELTLATDGFNCVGTPVGHVSCVNQFMDERLTVLTREFQHLLPYPYPHDFRMMVRYCCNQKIVHLLRHIAPHIMAFASRFNNIIDQLQDDYYDLQLNSSVPMSIQDIPSNFPSLGTQHMTCLARVQMRALALGY